MTAAELRAWRAYRKWTQRELAHALGMSVSRIVDYEHGESRTDGRDAKIPRVVELALEALAARKRDGESTIK